MLSVTRYVIIYGNALPNHIPTRSLGYGHALRNIGLLFVVALGSAAALAAGGVPPTATDGPVYYYGGGAGHDPTPQVNLDGAHSAYVSNLQSSATAGGSNTTVSSSGCVSGDMFPRCTYISVTCTKDGSRCDPPMNGAVNYFMTCPQGGRVTQAAEGQVVCRGALVCPRGLSLKPDGLCYSACEAKTTKSAGFFDIGTNAAASPKILGCSGGCEVVFDGTSPAGSATVNGVKRYYAKGDYVATGSECTPSTSTPDPGTPSNGVPADTCSGDQQKGYVNGKLVCHTPGTPNPEKSPTDIAKTDSKTETKTNDDGSKSTKTTETTTNPDGSVRTRTVETTTRPDGSSDTKETVETSPGLPEEGSDDGDEDDGEEDDGEEETACEKMPSGEGCGGVPGGTSGLYAKGTRTVSEVLSTHKNSFMTSPFGLASSRFFSVGGGGSCPTVSGAIPYLNETIELDHLCSSMALNAYAVLKVCLLIVCSFFAWRVAVE